MKKLIAVFLAVFLFFPRVVFAQFDTCSGNNQPHGDRDFSIVLNAWVTADSGYSVTLERGNSGYVLWYTDADKIPDEYKAYPRTFYESGLAVGSHYNVLLTYESATNTLTYYRKLDGEPEASYVKINEATENLGTGNGSFKVEGDNVSNVECSDEAEHPQLPEFGDVCDAFNSVVQTWYGDGRGNGRLYISGNAQIRGATKNLTTGKRIVGFDEDNVFGDLTGSAPDWEQQINAGCDNERCWGDSGLRVPRQNLQAFPASGESGSLWVDTAETWETGRQVEGTLSVGNGGVLTLMSGTYWVDRIEINSSGSIVVPEGEEVILNVKELNVGGFLGMNIADIENNSQYDGYLRVNVYDSVPSQLPKVSFNNSATFIGLLYSEATAENTESVQFTNASKVYGAVTAVSVQLNSGAQIFASSSCLDSTPVDGNYTLVLSPETDIALVCEDIMPTVSVIENGQLASGFNGTVVVTFDGSEQRYSGVSNQFTIQSGGASRTVSVTAYIEGEQNSSVSGSYEFVPYKFAASDQYVIANKAENVEVKALACDDNGGVVDAGYSGLPVVQYSWTTPSSGASGGLTYAPEFASGTANSGLVLDNAGKIEVSLEDTNFDCSGLADCPIEGRGALKGNFMVYSRPWTFALCSTNNTDLDSATGTSSGGAGFIAAGKEFDLRVVPVKYQSAIAGEVESNSAWCSASNITSNFFLDSSFSNHVKLSSEVATPDLHESNVLLASSGAMAKPRVNSDKEYKFTNLYWNDVGSLKVMASTENYSQTCGSPIGLEDWYECTQLGYRNIGRFYPKYFHVYKDDINTNEWAYPNSQSFTYMGQPFGAKVFYIEALSEKYSALNNYKFFSESLQAQFSLIESGEYAARFSTPKTYSGSWEDNGLTGVNSRSIGRFEGTENDGIVMAKDTTSYKPDGPLNLSEISTGTDNRYTEVSISGLGVSANVDPVAVEEGTLAVQPDIRFGRVDLDDVGGSQGSTLHIPLRVEYWNGSRFIVNLDDSQTRVFGVTEKNTQQPIWPEVGSKTVTLGAGGEVAQGSSRSVTATEAEPYRQQTRVWLELNEGSNALPWLKYNWEEEGEGELVVEENPSSVVTFGIHRGNDRVIYRGEPGLTGQ
ncbi:DUF6701 domain-containing protein [Vibrio alginolyticus]